MKNVRIRSVLQFHPFEKKHPRAAVWQIYLNLVTKGVFYILLQASKFPKEKLAHRRTIRTPVK